MHRRLETAGTFEITDSNPLILQKRRVSKLWSIVLGWNQGVSVTTRFWKPSRPGRVGLAECWSSSPWGQSAHCVAASPGVCWWAGRYCSQPGVWLFSASWPAHLSTAFPHGSSLCQERHWVPGTPRGCESEECLCMLRGVGCAGLASTGSRMKWQWMSFSIKTLSFLSSDTFGLGFCSLSVPKTPDPGVWDKIFSCSVDCSGYRKCLSSFHAALLSFQRGNKGWRLNGFRKKWKCIQELSWFLHCALCRFSRWVLPTTLPGSSYSAYIRDGKTEAQKAKAMCTGLYC